MALVKTRAGFIKVDDEIKEIFVDDQTGEVTYRHEQDEVTYEFDILVADPIQAQPALYNLLEKGEFGEAIGVIVSREGYYVIVDGHSAELRPLSAKRGEALETFDIALYIEADNQED